MCPSQMRYKIKKKQVGPGKKAKVMSLSFRDCRLLPYIIYFSFIILYINASFLVSIIFH